MRLFQLAVTLSVSIILAGWGSAQPATQSVAQWREDLGVLSSTLKALHPNPFLNLPAQEFDSAVARLHQDIPVLSEVEIMVEMARIAAMIGDAHTSLPLHQSATRFRIYPVRLQWFSDGLFVTEAGPEYRQALARKVVRIGDASIDDLLEAVAEIISHENDSWLEQISQDYLRTPEILFGLHVLDEPEEAPFVFEEPGGETFSLPLMPIPEAGATDWILAPDPTAQGSIPLYRKDSDRAYWFRYLSDGDLLYFKYNRARDEDVLTFAEMSSHLFSVLDQNPVAKLVFDLRNNQGGNSGVIQPLLTGLAERFANGQLDQLSGAFVAIGRETFSSGMLNAIDIKTGAPDLVTLIGEPSGGKPNAFGEVRSFQLPNSGLSVFHSTRFFQVLEGDPQSLQPDTLLRLSSQAFFEARDPILDHILGDDPPTTARVPFTLPQGGGSSFRTSGQLDSVTIASGLVQPRPNDASPWGLAIFSSRQEGIVVSEATVPASRAVRSGRVFAESSGSSRTGLALANPNSEAAAVSFFFTAEQGGAFGYGQTVIPAGGQMARFVDEEPFDSGALQAGSLTFQSTQPVAAIALRGLQNQKSQFLITTLPIANTDDAQNEEPIFLAHVVDGGGASTEVILLNPSDQPQQGLVEFFSQDGQPMQLTIDDDVDSAFGYALPAQGALKLKTQGSNQQARVGSARIVPLAGSAPQGLAVFSLRQNGVVVSQASVPAASCRPFFVLYAEIFGHFKGAAPGSLSTAVAITNPAQESIEVTLVLRSLNGAPQPRRGRIEIPAQGQIARFLHEIPGLEGLSAPFQGSLTMTSDPAVNFSVVGLRGRFNENGRFLITATSPFDETSSPEPLLFPHMVEGSGFTTQIALVRSSLALNSSGSLIFSSQAGQQLSLFIR